MSTFGWKAKAAMPHPTSPIPTPFSTCISLLSLQLPAVPTCHPSLPLTLLIHINVTKYVRVIPGHVLGLAALFCVAEGLLAPPSLAFGLCYLLQPTTFLFSIKAGCSEEEGMRKPHVSQYIQRKKKMN